MPRLFGIGGSSKTFEFKCADCGRIHRGSPSFAYDEPVYLFDVPETERSSRVKVDKDLCTILPAADDPESHTMYAIRTTLDIPIHGVEEPFCWGVWVTQSKESFDRYVATFSGDQTGMGSFGWMAVNMTPYKRTGPGEPLEHLRCDVDWGPTGKRPQIRLQECDHQLRFDQQDGITWDRAVEIARLVMHG